MTAPALRPHRDDVSIAVAGLVGGLLLWWVGLRLQAGRPLDGAWVLLPLTATAGLELLRRTRPLTALAVGALALVGDQCTSGSLATLLMFSDLVYASVRYGTRAAAHWIPIGTGLLTLAAVVGFTAWLRRPEALFIGVLVGLVGFGPAATGALVRGHREAAGAARRQAEQSVRLAELDRRQAVTAERTRMARELHDMVANRLSAIAIHSTAALSLIDPGAPDGGPDRAAPPDAARQALAVIRENSVDGLAEMRRMIFLLREGGGEPEPAAVPTLDGLGALVARARANGLDAVLEDVRPPGHELPAPVELAAYRIAQESLTNALKHAAPGPVTVRLAQQGGSLTLRVTSPYAEQPAPPGSPGTPGATEAPGTGAGLVGMRERAALLQGTFRAGPRRTAAGRCWQVLATLPAGHPGSAGPEQEAW